MKTYTIEASEISYYTFNVEANSKAEAIKLVNDGEVSLPAPCDFSDFTILN